MVGWLYWQQTRLFQNMNSVLMAIGDITHAMDNSVPAEPEPESKPVPVAAPEPVEEDEDDRASVALGVLRRDGRVTRQALVEAARVLDRLMRVSGGRIRPGSRSRPERIKVPPIGVIARRSTQTVAVADPLIASVIRFVGKRACERVGIRDVVREIGLSRWVLEDRFRRAVGHSIHDEILRVRLAEAQRLVTTTDLPLKVIAPRAGVIQRLLGGQGGEQVKTGDSLAVLVPDTDEIAWRLGFEGDFALVDDLDAVFPTFLSPLSWFYQQHGMVFVAHEGSRTRILMFDNGFPRNDAVAYRIALVAEPLPERPDPRKPPFKTWAEIAEATKERGFSNGTGWKNSDRVLKLTCGRSTMTAAPKKAPWIEPIPPTTIIRSIWIETRIRNAS
jgi:AraC-like DNA-binding protein